MSLKVSFIITALPNYSETFLRSLFQGLSGKNVNVRVFLYQQCSTKEKFNYVNPYPAKSPWVFVLLPLILGYLFLRMPRVVMNFIRLEQSVGRSILQAIKSLYRNAHIFLATRPDWIHFSFATIALGQENVAAALGAKLAVSIRGFDIALYPLSHKGCYTVLWSKLNKLHTISDDLYKLALRQGLSPQTEYKKIQPAIHTDYLKSRPFDREFSKPVKMISVGRLVWKKGFENAIVAMRLLKDRGYDVEYTIIGTGMMEEQLRYAIDDMGLTDSVFLLGKVDHDRVFDYLQQSDIYIQPSIQEGFCNALLEAQGSALLCICTNAEGLNENVIDGETGWLVSKRDPQALANRIEWVLNLPLAKRSEIALNASTRVRNEFHIDRLLNEFVQFYSIS